MQHIEMEWEKQVLGVDQKPPFRILISVGNSRISLSIEEMVRLIREGIEFINDFAMERYEEDPGN